MRTVLVAMIIGGALLTTANVEAGVLSIPKQPLPSPYIAVADKEMTVTTASANLRDKASTKGKILAKLTHGTKVMVMGTSGTWLHVKVNNMEGYVSSQLLR
jgi:mannosyl-glycoprotein endo-beta-N-acetylglucosaminidase